MKIYALMGGNFIHIITPNKERESHPFIIKFLERLGILRI